ncbi:MAG: class I SAM-dependent rRNA methyltransferase [Bacteroidota bacterium]
MIKVVLRHGKDEAVRRFHPWIFSGAIKEISEQPADGDVVEVYSAKREYLGTGHFQDGSITVRLFDFAHKEINFEFWKEKLQRAYNYRTEIGLTDNIQTNAYRLVFGEGDGLPGLIVDFYNGTAVIQAHSIGMHRIKNEIAQALKEIYGDKLKAVYYKSAETLPAKAAENSEDGYLLGAKEETIITENGNNFAINWETGQKTGFFVDQRDNRTLLAKYSKDKKILNTYCYSGSFSVYALNAGATMVHSVDSSKKAIELTEKNIELNGYAGSKHISFADDAQKFIEKSKELYDIVILDPPAFAKHNAARHNAIQGYKRLNADALRLVKSGGMLFTFSCSQVIDRNLFNSTVISAAILSGRNVRIMHQLSQPADHPINAYHPEGQYLKGLVLYVE